MSELLANYTSLHVGGLAKKFIRTSSENELVEAIKAADSAGDEVLIMGGGSNVLISDAGFNGTVIHVETKGNTFAIDACSGGMITVASGENWDEFVAFMIEKGFAVLRVCLEFQEVWELLQFKISAHMAMRYQRL